MPRSTRAEEQAATEGSGGSLVCLHCLVHSMHEPRLSNPLTGLDGSAPVRLASAGAGLWLVVSHVPRSRYDEAAIEAGLRDMDWVARHALAHEQVVAHFLGSGTLIPMKLFTLYHDQERALEDVAGRRAEIDAIVEDLRGKQEWGLRILAASDPPAPGPPPAEVPGRSASPGTEFLRRKQSARVAAQTAAAELQDRAEELFERFEHLAVRSHRRERLPEAAGSRLILDAAFLVETQRSAEFRDEWRRSVAPARDAGLELVLSGPWAAYNFVEPHE